VPVGSAPAFGCNACGGLWLEPEAAVHVMQGLGDALDSELAATSKNQSRVSKSPAPPDAGSRACPRCAQPMMRVVVGETTVDTCAAHGTWFDKNELDGVVAACRKMRAAQAPEDENVITADGVATGLGFVVTSTASLAWASIVTVVEAAIRYDRDDDDRNPYRR
jgi:Zn-finger nucleic acid-binding protein